MIVNCVFKFDYLKGPSKGQFYARFLLTIIFL